MSPLRRLGILGDVHAEPAALAAALEALRGMALDRLLCVGDVVDGPGEVQVCCDHLRAQGVAVVRGNHDRWLLEGACRDLPEATPPEGLSSGARRYLAQLPETLSFETARGPLLLCHGLGPNDMGRLTPDDYGYALESNDDLQELIAARRYRFVVNGHTHRRMVRSFGSLTIVNAGTLKRTHGPKFAVADWEAGRVTFWSLDGDLRPAAGDSVALPGAWG